MIKSKLLVITGILLVALFLMTGCSISIDGEDVEVGVNDVRESESDQLTFDNVTAVSAKITDNVGSVDVEYSDNSSAVIDVEYKVTGMHRDELKEILAVAALDCQNDPERFELDVINKETGEDIWDWIEDEYGVNKPNLSVELDITLPKAVETFDISCDVGNVDLDSLNGKFDVKTDVGSVKADDINFTSDSSITVDVGDIDCTLNKELSEQVRLELTSNVGSIRLDTANLDYTTEDNGKDDFVGTSKTILVNNLCEIVTKIDVGKVNIR